MLPEPYRIRSVEPIHLLPPAERADALERAGFNLFKLRAREVFIDLLTDSGTGAMSNRQWASLHAADESYAGSDSFERFEAAVRRITGLPEVIPTHQGRAAERVLFEVLLRPGDVVASNGLFDTTRANVERVGGKGVDLPDPRALDLRDPSPLKGGIDVVALEKLLSRERVRAVVLTATSNSLGGHPVPLENVVLTKALCRAHGVPLFLDAARFAQNAGLLIQRDPNFRGTRARELARAIFDEVDGCLMSAKKDGIAHIGGFLALRDAKLAAQLRDNLIITEGFDTYGGLAGRDLDAIAIGLDEALDDALLMSRLNQVADFHARLTELDVPVMRPAGGHAVYLDAGTLLPHLRPDQFPGHALACALYLEGGVRSCEIGSLMFPGRRAGPELTRLAIPWRTYTAAHLEFVAEAAARICRRAREIHGMRIVSEPPALRHFHAQLAVM